MRYSLSQIPFSTYGSYLVISKIEEQGIFLRDMHGGDEAPSNMYRIIIQDHVDEEIEVKRTETELRLISKKTKDGMVGFVMEEGDRVHCKVKNLTLIFEAMGGAYNTLVPLSENRFEHHLYDKQRKIMFTGIQGTIAEKQRFDVIGSKDAKIMVNTLGRKSESYITIEGYRTICKKSGRTTYEEAKNTAQHQYQKWENLWNEDGGCQGEIKNLAIYLTYCNMVCKEGILTSDAMYMSMNWMNNIWSWDNCFGAIFLSGKKPELAFGQLKIFFDHQDHSGCYPDYVNETFASYNCVKPPIFAWAYEKMRKQNPFFNERERLSQVYQSLCGITHYWMEYRRDDRAEFPVYYHGNDSGWDNASVFHKGFPVESPDLSAFLIFQMDWLSKTAHELGDETASLEWKIKGDHYFKKYQDHFYIDGQYRAFYVPEGKPIMEGDSLLLYLPILIGYRMEKTVLEQMVKDLEERFESTYGLATEALASNKYKEGGYWLGPMWAPTTYLFIDALAVNGYKDVAKRLGGKFIKAAAIGLMAENYNPSTGEGYDDPAFSWSSCVYLQLCKEYCH